MRRSTTVPWWSALWVLVKYRSSRNFRSGAYLGARLGASAKVLLQQRMWCWPAFADDRYARLACECASSAY